MVAVSLFLMLKGRPMSGPVGRTLGSNWLYLASLASLLMGAGLLAACKAAVQPAAVEVLGWLLVLCGLGLVVLSRSAARRLARWLQSLPPWLARLVLLPALGSGAYLLWVAVA
jgi:hypothetical protein